MTGTLNEPPLRTAARYLTTVTNSVACSIYALAAPDLESERRFYLAGTHGCDPETAGPCADFYVRAADYEEVKQQRSWKGFTTFVALSDRPLRLASVDDSHWVKYLAREVEVTRNPNFSELRDPGPFLCVPIKVGDAVIGVIRVQRRRGAEEYLAENEEQLFLLAPLLGISITLEQARTRILRVVSKLSETKDDDELLEAVAAQARELVQADHHGACVFLEAPTKEEVPKGERTFELRSPAGAKATVEKRTYKESDKSLTGTVIRDCEPILSLNLRRDLEEGHLEHIVHVSSRAETATGTTNSWLGVPIPGADPHIAIGAIRIASSELAAFSVHDQETLRVLAHQTSAILRAHRARRELAKRERAYDTLIELGPRPTISVRDGRIEMVNNAATELLGYSEEELKAHGGLENLVYGGNRALAGETLRALKRARQNKLRGHYTLVFRKSTNGGTPIPTPVRVDVERLKDPAGDSTIGTIGFIEDLRDEQKTLSYVARFGPPNNQGITVDEGLFRQLEEIQNLPDEMSDVPILIIGETGTGKELVVDMLCQRAADRRRKSNLKATEDSDTMRKFNCAEFPESLLESELFGYLQGAFTGALKDKVGVFDPQYFKKGERRMLFLDEIAELSLSAQAKLLRVLDRHFVRRVGAMEEEPLEVDLVAATWMDLDERVREGRFRADLKNRLESYVVRLPPLRKRRNDVMLLAMHFLNEDRPAKPLGFTSDAIRALLAATWPGNIRELRNAIRAARSVYIARGAGPSRLIDNEHLWPRLRIHDDGALDPDLAHGPSEARGTTPPRPPPMSSELRVTVAYKNAREHFLQIIDRDPSYRVRLISDDKQIVKELEDIWKRETSRTGPTNHGATELGKIRKELRSAAASGRRH